MGMVKLRFVLSSDPTLLELLTFGASEWGKKFELSHSDGNSSFKIGSDDNWGMTQAPQLIRTKISRTKRDTVIPVIVTAVTNILCNKKSLNL